MNFSIQIKIAPFDIYPGLLKIKSNKYMWTQAFGNVNQQWKQRYVCKIRFRRCYAAVNPWRTPRSTHPNESDYDRELFVQLRMSVSMATLEYHKVVPGRLSGCSQKSRKTIECIYRLLNYYNVEGDSFLDRIIIGSEMRCYHHAPDLSHQRKSAWRSHQLAKVCTLLFGGGKVLLAWISSNQKKSSPLYRNDKLKTLNIDIQASGVT